MYSYKMVTLEFVTQDCYSVESILPIFKMALEKHAKSDILVYA
jgi:hypothetical protein